MADNIIDVLDDEFENTVLKSEKPVLVDFWASWCMPCKMQGQILHELAPEIDGKIVVCKLNVDESEKIAIEYGITSIPTLILFNGGKAVEKVIGLTTKAELSEMLLKYLK